MSLNSITNDKICSVCSGPAAKKCLGCQNIYYCSQEHQKIDWERHKETCPPYKIERNEVLGRFLVATRNISKGTIIFREKPLVFGPKIYSKPICLGCHQRVNGSYFCSRCGYPMCSKTCENVPAHRENECKIFEKKSSKPKMISDYNIPNAIYQSVLTLRFLLLRNKNAEDWKLLNSLEHHVDKRNSSQIWNEYQVNIVQFLRSWNNLEGEYSEQLINRVVGFIEVNSFQICTVKQVEYCGMFFLAAMMNHNCIPNTHHAFDETGTMIMRASVPIKKGEEITLSYVDTELGTFERQTILQQSKFFTCHCARCSDPTEFGTFISGIKCFSCDTGYLLPNDPFDLNSDWKCYRENSNCFCYKTECTKNVNVSQIQKVLSSVELEMQGQENEYSEANLHKRLKLGVKFLHPNHYFLLPIRNNLVRFYKKSNYDCIDTSTTTVLFQRQSFIADLLEVYNKITPGLNRTRGILLIQQLNLKKRLLDLRLKNGELSEDDSISEKRSILNLEAELEKLFELDLMIGVVAE